jgi:hypothetical protein
MLVTGAVWTGVIVTYAVERVNLWQRMPLDQYAVDIRRSLYRVDPLQPILAVICMIAALVFALNIHGAAEAFTWAGFGLVAAVVVWSVTLMEPINSRFRQLPEGTPPEGLQEIRDTWRRRHLARTVVAVAAMVCLAIAVTSP